MGDDIKKGDEVQLKSGGPLMTVEEVEDYSSSAGPKDGVCCVWFDNNKLMKEVFDRATLEIYHEE